MTNNPSWRNPVRHDILGILVDLTPGQDVQVTDETVAWTEMDRPEEHGETLVFLKPDILNDFIALGLDRNEPVFGSRTRGVALFTKLPPNLTRSRQRSARRPKPGTPPPETQEIVLSRALEPTQPGTGERTRIANYVRGLGGLFNINRGSSDIGSSALWSLALADGMEPAKSVVHTESISAWIKLAAALGFIVDEIEDMNANGVRQPRFLLPYEREGPGTEAQWNTVLAWFQVSTKRAGPKKKGRAKRPLPLGGGGETTANTKGTTERQCAISDGLARRFAFERYFPSSFGDVSDSVGDRLDWATFEGEVGTRIVDEVTESLSDILHLECSEDEANRNILKVRAELEDFAWDLWTSGLELATPTQCTGPLAWTKDLKLAFAAAALATKKPRNSSPWMIANGITGMKRRMDERCNEIYRQYTLHSRQPGQEKRIVMFMNELLSTASYHLEVQDILGGQPMRLFAHDLYSALILQFAGTVVSGTFRPCGGCREIASILPAKSDVRKRKPRYNATFYCDECLGNGMARRHATAKYRGKALPFRPSRMQ